MTLPEHPSYVMHDDVRWHVENVFIAEGEDWYFLKRGSGGGMQSLSARATDCTPWSRTKPIVRKLKDEGYVLEFDGRSMSIRKTKSPTRWPVSLAGIYCAAVRAQTIARQFAAKKKARHK